MILKLLVIDIMMQLSIHLQYENLSIILIINKIK